MGTSLKVQPFASLIWNQDGAEAETEPPPPPAGKLGSVQAAGRKLFFCFCAPKGWMRKTRISAFVDFWHFQCFIFFLLRPKSFPAPFGRPTLGGGESSTSPSPASSDSPGTFRRLRWVVTHRLVWDAGKVVPRLLINRELVASVGHMAWVDCVPLVLEVFVQQVNEQYAKWCATSVHCQLLLSCIVLHSIVHEVSFLGAGSAGKQSCGLFISFSVPRFAFG